MTDRLARPALFERPRSVFARLRRGPLARLLAGLAIAALALGPLAPVGAAAGDVTMAARVLLQGHARAGAWMAIEVSLENDGPAISGELRMQTSTQSTTRFATAVDLPTASRKTFFLYAQPPAFGRTIKIDLVAEGATLQTTSVAYLAHDLAQLVVGVVAERAESIIADLDLPPSINNSPAVLAPLSIGDLPERVEGWAALDRLIWQDVDASRLSKAQLAALRGWLASGGRLVIVGGTAGIGTLGGFPDDLLPYRPTSTMDLAPVSFASLLGGTPATAGDVPTMTGNPGTGRLLASSGDRWAAADLTYGNGSVTLLGFDPTTKGIGGTDAAKALWGRLLPARSGSSSPAISDDSNLLSATGQVPSLALPPVGGLLILLLAYIAVIGPINYLVLRRLDRRELAWITMPVFVVGFAVAAFGYGAFLRGTDVVVNQVAIVRGAPDTTEGAATVYFGLFSPDRHTYQVEVPGGALLAAPISGDIFGSSNLGALDILQGDPAQVRNLEVGYASLRTVRGETATTVPRMRADLQLDGNTLRGTFENASDEALESVAIVLGSSVVVLGDVPAHSSKSIILPLKSDPFGSALADKVLGQMFDSAIPADAARLRSIRYSLVNQLIVDPTGMGFFPSSLQNEQPVILAFAQRSILDVRVSGQTPRATGSVLYYVPVPMTVRGKVTFGGDLIRSTVIENQAVGFAKDPWTINLSLGTATLAYRPVAYSGSLAATSVDFILDFPGSFTDPSGGERVEPLGEVPVICTDLANSIPEGCVKPAADGIPEVEVFDRTGDGGWVRLPHLRQAFSYTLADPARYVDPRTGAIVVRFVNENPQMQIAFSFRVAITGVVE